MSVDFKISQNNLSCIKSGLKFSFHENLNEIGSVAFPWVLGLHIDDDDKKIETLRQKAFKTRASKPYVQGSGNLKTDILVENSTSIFLISQ